MVKPFDIADGDPNQHKKCILCQGKKADCNQLVQCSFTACGKYKHLSCLAVSPLEQGNILALEYHYCSKKCQDSHEPERIILEALKDPKAAAAIKILEKRNSDLEQKTAELAQERDKALHAAEVLDETLKESEEKTKRLEADKNISLLSSTGRPSLLATGTKFFDANSTFIPPMPLQTGGPSTSASAAQSVINETLSRLSERARNLEASRQQPFPSIVNPLSYLNGTFSSDEITNAHALASLTLSLSERRKQLPKLPEFDGKGSEWLHFENTYKALREEGKYDNREMIAKLSCALKGKALEYTRLWLYSSRPNPDKIMADLKDRYFSPQAVMTDALDAVKDISPIRYKDRNSLEVFKRAVDGYISVCTDVEDTPPLMIRVPEEVEDKLPNDYLEKWMGAIRRKLCYGNWFDLSLFLQEATSDLKIRACDRKKSNTKDTSEAKGNKNSSGTNAKVHVVESSPTETKPASLNAKNSRNNSNSRGNRSKNRGGYQNSPRVSRMIGDSPPCDYDECGEPIYRCKGFAKREYDIKIANCRLKGYCIRCLRKGHPSNACPNIALLPKCNVSNCTDPGNHTTVMHPPEGRGNVGHFNNGKGFSLFQVAKVLVDDVHGNQIPVTVFLDSGSNATLITHDLYKRLGLKGQNYNLMVSWCAAGVNQESNGSFKTEITLAPEDNPSDKHVLKNVISMENLRLPLQEQNEEELHAMFPHLRQINVPEFELQRPQILIGLHHRALAVAERVILPPPNESSVVAEKTRLGWVLSCANLPNFSTNAVDLCEPSKAIRKSPVHTTCTVTLEDLNKLVKHFLNLEYHGSIQQDVHFLTSDEQRAKEILEKGMRKIGKRYEVPLLWKSDNAILPDNSSTALSRLKSSEAALRKKNLVEWANNHHKALLDLGFAREATPSELNPEKPHKRVNYVIGFAVINPHKPDKPRWVVDTACNHEGVSLNSALLKGSDNLVPLTQTLFHFRERAIATCADVEKQFHQIKIAPEDVQCQRYFYRDCDPSKEPKTYIFTSMLFGPTDSPYKANAVRIRHSLDSAQSFPDASRAALDSMYMDDLFNSEDNVDEAINVSRQSIKMFAEISWKLTDFRSNSSEVLKSLPSDHLNVKALVELSKDDPTLACCKVLGLYWNPEIDSFEFKQSAEMELRLKTLNEGYVPTKLEIFSFVLRVFDCLGLISHFIVRGRMIIQETWKAQLDWNQKITADIFEGWKLWLEQFEQIARLKIPRHYGYISSKVTSIELHIFTDASTKAYAAVGYFRLTFANGTVKVTLIFSKTRVAPLKERTFPKLELDGALTGVKIAKIITNQHKRLSILNTVLWTDSEIVLRWIRGVHLKLLPYVAPRVSEIRDTYPISSWRYCPSQLNPADHGTKHTQIDFSDHTHYWFTGPKFLYEPPENWPQDKNFPNPASEVTVLATQSVSDPYYAGVLEIISPPTRAKWDRYRSVVAHCLRFVDNLKIKIDLISEPIVKSDIIEASELIKAENVILKSLQFALWEDEITLLMGGRTLTKKHSRELISLGSLVVIDGLLRCRTRYATEETFPQVMRFPIVLPNSHEVVDAIVRYAHEQNNHFGVEATIAKLRSRYWIIRCRTAVKRAIRRCLYCIEQRCKPYNIPEGDLPNIRITPTIKAFHHVGADCFGPFTIYSGESKRKREVNVVIFTCLTSRAIFLHRLNKLSKEEMFVAVQNLWTRRGPINSIRSDNGKNFLGCANILEREFRQGLSSKFGIKWIFNPALTPQWGGTWERLIKDVKTAMKAVMKTKIVCERVFDCILYQVEDIINSRPLTHVPATPDDEFPLTPNQLVKFHPGYEFLSDTSQLPHPGNAEWYFKKAQKFSNQVWSRWCKEYLPIITQSESHSKRGAKRDIHIGDFVIYCDPTTHPQSWSRGIVTNVYKGRDGLARVADIRLRDGKIITKRSAYRLARIPIADSDFNDHPGDLKVSTIVNTFFQTSLNDFIRPKALRLSDSPLVNNNKKNLPIIKVFQIQATMSHYCRIDFNLAIEILRSVAREPLYPSSLLIKPNKSSSVKNMIQLAQQYGEIPSANTVKLSGNSILASLADLLITFASLKVKPAWIFADDMSKPSPQIIFVKFHTSDDADQVVALGRIEILTGALNVTRPTYDRQMTLYGARQEHALIKFQHDEGEQWKILFSRVENLTHQEQARKTHSSIIPRAVPMMGLIWGKRLNSTIDQETFEQLNDGQWSDFRVKPFDPPTMHIPDAEIRPTERMLSELNVTRFIRANTNNIHVNVIASTIEETSRDIGTQTFFAPRITYPGSPGPQPTTLPPQANNNEVADIPMTPADEIDDEFAEERLAFPLTSQVDPEEIDLGTDEQLEDLI